MNLKKKLESKSKNNISENTSKAYRIDDSKNLSLSEKSKNKDVSSADVFDRDIPLNENKTW